VGNVEFFVYWTNFRRVAKYSDVSIQLARPVKMKSIFTNFTTAILILSGLFTSCVSNNRTSQISYVRNSVVLLRLHDINNGKSPNDSPMGTGFFISESQVATAWHLSRDLENQQKERGMKNIEIVMEQKRPEGDVHMTFQIHLQLTDIENDLAIYKFDSTAFKKQWTQFEIIPLPLSENLPEIAEEVVITGYDGSHAYPFSSIGSVSMITETNHETVVENDDKTNRKFLENQMIYSDATMIKGNSGGPLYSLISDKVVGVNIILKKSGGSIIRTSGATNSIHLLRLLELAKSTGD
jgi:S1-C subfamily serine protease